MRCEPEAESSSLRKEFAQISQPEPRFPFHFASYGDLMILGNELEFPLWGPDSMSANEHFTSSYYRDQLRLFVHCTGAGCTVDVAQPVEDCCPAYHLELLLQPTDPHGWPQGSVRLLYEADITMSGDCWSTWSRGFHRLPFRLSPELLRRCHIRLKCNTVRSPGEQLS